MPEPYSRRWLEQHIEQKAIELAWEMQMWMNRDREAPYEAKAIAARITNIARSLSADTHAIGQIDYEEYVRGQ